MPLPLILGGAALVSALYGAKKGVDAKSDYDSAERNNRWAKETYDDAEEALEQEKNNAQKSMERLGLLKFSIYEECLCPFVEEFSKIKNIDFNDNRVLENATLPAISHQDLNIMTASTLKMNEVVNSGVAALGSGGVAGLAAYGSVGLLGTASTGTGIATLSGAAASNATLAWLGGGSLASGGLGMAGGTMILGGIVAGPILAIGGMVMASKAEEAKENAYANLAQAELLAEEMKTATVITHSIKSRLDEVHEVLSELKSRFSPLLQSFETLISSNGIDYRTYSEEDKKGVFILASLAKTIKLISDSPLIDENGIVTKESREAISSGKDSLTSIGSSKIENKDIKLETEEPSVINKSVTKEAKSFEDLLDPYGRNEDRLNDGSYIFSGMHLGSSKGTKKTKGAVSSYAYINDTKGDSPWGDLLVLIDSTIFGSGKDGIYITDDEIYIKPVLEDRIIISINDIKSIQLYKNEQEFKVNGTRYSYVHPELDGAMKIIVNCIKEYIEQ